MRQEANKKEITLHDDDPDAIEAMLRHIYNFWLRPPFLFLSTSMKVQFYCNVVVVSDKCDPPALGDEARKDRVGHRKHRCDFRIASAPAWQVGKADRAESGWHHARRMSRLRKRSCH